VWQLNAASAEEAAHWAQVLTEAIQASSGVQTHTVSLTAPGQHDEEGNEASQETEVGVAAGMWLVKAGEGLGRDRRRWFVLQKGLASQTLRLTYFGDQRNGQGIDRKGCIALSGASSVGHDGKLVTIVSALMVMMWLRACVRACVHLWLGCYITEPGPHHKASFAHLLHGSLEYSWVSVNQAVSWPSLDVFVAHSMHRATRIACGGCRPTRPRRLPRSRMCCVAPLLPSKLRPPRKPWSSLPSAKQ
jgi:hypothetical protein